MCVRELFARSLTHVQFSFRSITYLLLAKAHLLSLSLSRHVTLLSSTIRSLLSSSLSAFGSCRLANVSVDVDVDVAANVNGAAD